MQRRCQGWPRPDSQSDRLPPDGANPQVRGGTRVGRRRTWSLPVAAATLVALASPAAGEPCIDAFRARGHPGLQPRKMARPFADLKVGWNLMDAAHSHCAGLDPSYSEQFDAKMREAGEIYRRVCDAAIAPMATASAQPFFTDKPDAELRRACDVVVAEAERWLDVARRSPDR